MLDGVKSWGHVDRFLVYEAVEFKGFVVHEVVCLIQSAVEEGERALPGVSIPKDCSKVREVFIASAFHH